VNPLSSKPDDVVAGGGAGAAAGEEVLALGGVVFEGGRVAPVEGAVAARVARARRAEELLGELCGADN
jgi:hypothetical protein